MKRLICLLLSFALMLTLLCAFAQAATIQQECLANAMYDLGLFLGAGDSGFLLDQQLHRSDGITLLVRMLGAEAKAKNTKNAHPFSDVPQWLDCYVGYAYAMGITNGVSKDRFGSDANMTQAQFLTLTLRALGYSDGGENPQYTWDKPHELSFQIGLLAEQKESQTFTRGDAVTVFWNALSCKLYNQKITLRDRLIQDGCFTLTQYNTAASKLKTVIRFRADNMEKETEDQQQTEQPPEQTPEEEQQVEPGKNMTWEEYQKLTPEQQAEFYNGFSSAKAYYEWYQKAWNAYQTAQTPPEIIGGDNIIVLS